MAALWGEEQTGFAMKILIPYKGKLLNSFEGHEGIIGHQGGSLPRGEHSIPTKALDAAKIRTNALISELGGRLKKVENLQPAELLKITGRNGILATDLWREKSGMGTSDALMFARNQDESQKNKLVRRWSKIYRARGVEEVSPEFHSLVEESSKSFYSNPRMQDVFARFGKIPVFTCTKDDWGGDVPQARYEGTVIEVFDGSKQWWGQGLKSGASTTTPGGISIPDKSLEGVLHHEYGHHVQNALNDVQDPLVKEWPSLWSTYKSSYDADYKAAAHEDGTWTPACKEVEKTRISDYSLTKEGEGFAEAFAAVTASDYSRDKYDKRCHPMLELMERIVK